MAGGAISIFGDGMQVHDALYADDLIAAMDLALAKAARLRGRAFNMGGGPGRTVSLLELLDLITELNGVAPQVRFSGWRVGDQRWFVSDTRAFGRATGWAPRVDVASGV